MSIQEKSVETQQIAALDPLQSLARRVRLLTAVLMLISLVLVVVIVAAAQATQPVEVRARRFVLVNEKGEMRAELATSDSGAGLVFYLSDGNPRLFLSLRDDVQGAVIGIGRPNPNSIVNFDPEVMIGSSGGESPNGLFMYGTDPDSNKQRVILELSKDKAGSPHVYLRNVANEVLFEAPGMRTK
jgi:hypothetical protein